MLFIAGPMSSWHNERQHICIKAIKLINHTWSVVIQEIYIAFYVWQGLALYEEQTLKMQSKYKFNKSNSKV